ncbi:MAG TPA: acylphosphatase [Deltaproteobacteria bacterium]|nr:acylphosphatase [Deltaproteobacteria bacterium]
MQIKDNEGGQGGLLKALHIKVAGRVQGVWFRAGTQKAAQDLDLAGWVRNMPDGAVEIHIQGEKTSVDRLLSWCYHGSCGARVDKVDFNETEVDPLLKGFSIRY